MGLFSFLFGHKKDHGIQIKSTGPNHAAMPKAAKTDELPQNVIAAITAAVCMMTRSQLGYFKITHISKAWAEAGRECSMHAGRTKK